MTEVTLDATLLRALSLYIPLGAVAVVWWWRRPSRQTTVGVFLAVVWNASALLAVNVIAQAAGWWRFQAEGGMTLGMPVDLLLGWALLWGAAGVLALRGQPMAVVIAAMTLADVALMPQLRPVVVLGPAWLVGEALALAVSLVPGLLLTRWTAADAHLYWRCTLQLVLAGALVLWLLPATVLGDPSGLAALLAPLPRPVLAAVLALLGLCSLLGVAAVQEFAERGSGTPLPYDPPKRLVVTGPYAFTANPMQISVTLILAVMAVLSRDLRFAAAAVVSVAYSAGLALWHEDEDLRNRFGAPWEALRAATSPWRIRRRPHWSGPPATIWMSQTCEQCASVDRFLRSRRPIGLDVRAAEIHPGRGLARITYELGAQRWQGLPAIARALDHLHLGWAILGWVLRLPGVAHALQVVVDAAGGGPRFVAGNRDQAQSAAKP